MTKNGTKYTFFRQEKFPSIYTVYTKYTFFRQEKFPNIYTVRWLRYLDQIIWALRGKPVYWMTGGHLCHIISRNGKTWGIECRTHFAGKIYYAAIWLKTRVRKLHYMIRCKLKLTRTKT